eukprot:CAMPEP_0175120988 /NCGR_PEP_ID=MMETSP0087-20121206/921_1 /TAXON_ID=136419 /ORGANISM="Unknown Unknown, Strain D1" /LENGTH=402 /DNA_ID=CAMNT_0016402485 /DNA_START=83 /DNA_END=1292 /DNA_ORIENTATION=-
MMMTRGEGCYVYDEHGNKHLDFTSGIGVTGTGHCHPTVVKAVQRQAESLAHGQVNIAFHEPMLRLIERLLPVTPEGLDSFFFWNSGAEAVEAAVKIARAFTGRPNIVVQQGGYHGRTFGTMALTTSKAELLTPLGGVFVMPSPYSTHLGCPGMSGQDMADFCISQLQLLLAQQTAPGETAAVLVEPVLGEGGYVFPPSSYLQQLKAVCEQHGMLLIADEVQSGFGRTGKMFAVEHYGVVPDLLVMAKGLASGYPLSGVAGRQEVMHSLEGGSLGGTYAGNAVACAAAVATLDVFEQEGVLANVQARGRQLVSGLHRIADKHPASCVKEIRGKGLMVGMEFDSKGRGHVGKHIAEECRKNNMLLLTTSIFDTIRFIPALTVSEEEVNQALAVLDSAFSAVFDK